MNEIIDKMLLLLCCITLYILNIDNNFVIIPVIISVVLSCLFIYYDDGKFKITGCILFSLLCIFFPSYIIFLPLLLYDLLLTKYQYTAIVIPFLIICNFAYYTATDISFTVVFLIVAYLLKSKTNRLNILTSEYNELRDSSTQMSLLLEEKNQSLLQNQDYEINLATLNERNRISKEIHDNIGHLLSRALLQVGALLTITKDDIMKEELTTLKNSLSDGMDQIRSSIHNMYDESIDLYVQIEHLTKEFNYCPIHFEYDIRNQPSSALKHSLIAITKESLANIIRHSNATKVSLILREHPAMYQLIIHDNGTLNEHIKEILLNAYEKQDYGDGMGLHNIADRVKGFGGNIHITLDLGFKLFISIPKKEMNLK